MPDQKPDEIAIFSAAAELRADEQAAFLDHACQGDFELRERIAAYLRSERESGPLDAGPAAIVATLSQDIGTDRIGTWIGPYRLMEKIGEGGMGLVYRAEQKEPVCRTVALKLIKPGMDSRQVVARFESERQALALMDHPGVSRVLDAGTTINGTPYFVMEFVRGLPITEFCDREKLTTVQRLRLFCDVCRAVQHAHQKGIIHRDIKPSNVMVTRVDGSPVPKVIDFGIAKALSQQLSAHTLTTTFGEMVGTPMYMSPEQAEMNSRDVDTRSDVYSLGVLLYELLTGMTPFDRGTLKQAGVEGLRRIICNSEPAAPSVRINTLKNEQRSSISDNRRLDHRRLAQTLRGELDWIVMKTLEKDRNRRYASPAELAADIQCYLQGQPVVAAAPDVLYRTKKLARRHHRKLAAGAFAMLTLCAGLAIALVQRNEAIQARKTAEHHLEEVQRQKDRAESLLYAADISLAARALDDGDSHQAIQLLHQQLPTEGDSDRRGVEWHLLEQRTRAASQFRKISDSALYAICCTPDRLRLVTAGADGLIYILLTQTLTVERTLPSEQVEVNGLSLSKDGKTLISSGDDGTMRLWDFASGDLLRSVNFGSGKAWQALIDLQEEFLIACGESNDVRIFSLKTGEQVGALQGHERIVEAIALSPNEKWLACASSDRRMSVWDWRERRRVFLSPPQTGRLTCVQFSEDGSRLFDGSVVGEVRGTDVRGWTNLGEAVLHDPAQGLSVSPDGHSVTTLTRAGTVRVLRLTASGRFSTETDSEASCRVHEGRGYGLCWIDRGSVVSAGADGCVRRTRLSRLTSEGFEVPGVNARIACASPDGKLIAWAGDGQIGLYDRVHDRHVLLEKFPAVSDVSAVSFTPDGRQLVAATKDGRLLIVSVEEPENTITCSLPQPINITTLRFSRDGDRLAAASRADDHVLVLRYPSLDTLFRMSITEINNADISDDGRYLAANRARDIMIFDIDTGKSVRESVGHHAESIHDIQFVNSDNRIISVGDDRAAYSWEWQRSGEPQLIGIHRQVSGRTFRTFRTTRDGRTMFTTDRSGEVVVWNLPSRQKLFPLMQCESKDVVLDLSADESILVTVEASGRVSWIPLRETPVIAADNPEPNASD